MYFLPVTLALLVYLWRLTTNKHTRSDDYLLVAACLAFPANLACQALAHWLSRFREVKYDLYLHNADTVLGGPSWWAGRFLDAHPWVNLAAALVYELCPMAVIFVCWLLLYRGTREDLKTAAWAFALQWVALPFLYLACPAAGPHYAFADSFPTQYPGPIWAHPIPLAAAPNAFPSGHMANALLVLWFSRRWLWPTIGAVVFLALTILATLGTGEHYAVDLIASVPYCALVLWIVNASRTSSPRKQREREPSLVSG